MDHTYLYWQQGPGGLAGNAAGKVKDIAASPPQGISKVKGFFLLDSSYMRFTMTCPLQILTHILL